MKIYSRRRHGWNFYCPFDLRCGKFTERKPAERCRFLLAYLRGALLWKASLDADSADTSSWQTPQPFGLLLESVIIFRARHMSAFHCRRETWELSEISPTSEVHISNVVTLINRGNTWAASRAWNEDHETEILRLISAEGTLAGKICTMLKHACPQYFLTRVETTRLSLGITLGRAATTRLCVPREHTCV